MINWICTDCENKRTLANSIAPGKCPCGGWYVEDDNKSQKTYAEGYRQANDDLAKFIKEENEGETGMGHSVETLTTAINRLYAQLLEIERETTT